MRSIRYRLNHPLPIPMPIFVEGPSCAAAFPDFPSPVVAVGRNCECVCECSGYHHSKQGSNQKYAHDFPFHETPFCFLITTIRFLILFMARVVDFAVPLRSHTAFPLLDRCFPHISLICPS